MRCLVLFSAVFFANTGFFHAAAEEQSSRTKIDLQGIVDLQCDIIVEVAEPVENAPVLNAGVSLSEELAISGTAIERCNSPGGYLVSAYHRELADTEEIKLVYGDVERALMQNGSTFLIAFPRGGERIVPFSIIASSLDNPLVISFFVTPADF